LRAAKRGLLPGARSHADRRQKAVAPRAANFSLPPVNDPRRAFLGWTDCLLDPASTPREQRDAAHGWCDWALRFHGMEVEQLDPPGEACAQPTALATGEAISPQRAVLCLREQRRTAVYLRATLAAVRALQEKFPGQTLHLVEAGCGPAAPMALAMAARFAPEVLQVTLIDIHAASLADARRLAAALGVESSIRRVICGDAAAVRFAEDDRPHLVVAEVLRRALKAEPQVAVTRALAPQVRAGGFFLPERIAISPGFVLGSPASEGGRRLQVLDEIYALEADRARSPEPEADGWLPAREVHVPGGVDDQLQLFTRMRVFREHGLGDFECSLTMPERLRVPAEFVRAGGRLRMAYEISADPGLRVVSAEPAAAATA